MALARSRTRRSQSHSAKSAATFRHPYRSRRGRMRSAHAVKQISSLEGYSKR
jgi:hypothetical protein